jgi:hypothetical protein
MGSDGPFEQYNVHMMSNDVLYLVSQFCIFGKFVDQVELVVADLELVLLLRLEDVLGQQFWEQHQDQ